MSTMINIESKLLNALEQSTCFGIAHDDTVPECKQCDVNSQCKAKSDGASIPTPKSKPAREVHKSTTESDKSVKKTSTPKPASTPKTTTKPAEKSKAQSMPKETPVTSSNSSMPDFKPMGLPELTELAKQRNVEWKDYGNDNITRMRLIMALKKSY